MYLQHSSYDIIRVYLGIALKVSFEKAQPVQVFGSSRRLNLVHNRPAALKALSESVLVGCRVHRALKSFSRRNPLFWNLLNCSSSCSKPSLSFIDVNCLSGDGMATHFSRRSSSSLKDNASWLLLGPLESMSVVVTLWITSRIHSPMQVHQEVDSLPVRRQFECFVRLLWQRKCDHLF